MLWKNLVSQTQWGKKKQHEKKISKRERNKSKGKGEDWSTETLPAPCEVREML